MEKYTIQSKDPEIVEILDYLRDHRKTSSVIEALIRHCILEEGDGYFPGWLVSETGFIYKREKKVKKSRKRGIVSVFGKSHKKENENTEAKSVEEKPEKVIQAVVSDDDEGEKDSVEEVFSATDKKDDLNMELIGKGLAAFGI